MGRATARDDDERIVERHLCEAISARGGYCMKFVSPGMRGVADRIVVLPYNRVFFVELKQRGGRIRDHQFLWQSAMLEVGVNVVTLWSVPAVNSWVAKVCPQ
jgi:hypothetical protein